MARTVLPCPGDLSRVARNPGGPEMPHQGGVQGAGPAPLPELQSPLPDRRRNPRDADRGSETGGVEGLTPDGCAQTSASMAGDTLIAAHRSDAAPCRHMTPHLRPL